AAPNVHIFDTAGRQEIDQTLMDELKNLKEFLRPQEILLVVDAATGQQAVSVASGFDNALSITGIILTKLDGDARGGPAVLRRERSRIGRSNSLARVKSSISLRLSFQSESLDGSSGWGT